jgi:hypothetical protein
LLGLGIGYSRSQVSPRAPRDASGLRGRVGGADVRIQTRSAPIAEINGLLEQHITDRSLGIFDEPRVNVLGLNLALDAKYPKLSASLRLQNQAP